MAASTYHDYAPVEGWGWWPRWYPYWDPQWRAYWWQLYDYYGGDNYAEYAEYARDAMLRAYAPQWGLVVSGSLGTPQIGIQAYGVRTYSGAVSIPGPLRSGPCISGGRA